MRLKQNISNVPILAVMLGKQVSDNTQSTVNLQNNNQSTIWHADKALPNCIVGLCILHHPVFGSVYYLHKPAAGTGCRLAGKCDKSMSGEEAHPYSLLSLFLGQQHYSCSLPLSLSLAQGHKSQGWVGHSFGTKWKKQGGTT